ncbi:MAG: glycosyltransferase [Tannerella sp.]|jgi:GT2 family glycosyltransferase|nr:glycosyltransferase [Tannerella sp.]
MLNASIVLYRHKPDTLKDLVDVLTQAQNVSQIFLIDNSPVNNLIFSDIQKTKYIHNPKNLGYGKAHNIAIRETIKQGIEYHLVVNPDVIFKPEILPQIETYMSEHQDVGLLSPKMFSPEGELQYQCKLLPSPSDLIFRRFLPSKWTQKRQYCYEMRASGYDHIMEAPYLQGSFMFLRTETLMETGLFDERFFLYPEDIDLTRRIHQKYKTIFFPEAQIVHKHERASYKSLKMLIIHTREMIKYFNKWGWFCDQNRIVINNNIKTDMERDIKTI